MNTATVELVHAGNDDRSRSRSRRDARGVALVFFIAVATLLMMRPKATTTSAISATPRLVTFNAQPVGSSAQQRIAFTNGRTTPFPVTSFVIDGPSSTGFTVTTERCRTIPPGKRCFALVTFAPPAPGDYAASLTLASNDDRSETVELRGTGVAAPPTTETARLTAQPLRTIFQPQPVGSTTTNTIELANEGNGDFVLTGLVVDGTHSSPAFTISADPCSRIAPHQSCVATIAFTPPTEGQHAASIGLMSGSVRAATLQLEGTGATTTTTPPPAVPQLDVNPAALTIGATEKIGRAQITNRGNGTLHINSIVFETAAASLPLKGCPGDLDAGATCEVIVPRSGTGGRIRIDSNAPATPYFVPVTVEAPPQLPLLVSDPKELTIEPEQKEARVRLMNRGRGVLHIKSIALLAATGSLPIQSCLGDLQPDGECVLRIFWHGSDARIRIESDNPAGAVLIPVTVKQAVLLPSIEVPKEVHIGPYDKVASLRIANGGPGLLRITAVTARTRGGRLNLTGCGDVPRGGACVVTVPRDALNVAVESNAPGGTRLVAVIVDSAPVIR